MFCLCNSLFLYVFILIHNICMKSICQTSIQIDESVTYIQKLKCQQCSMVTDDVNNNDKIVPVIC